MHGVLNLIFPDAIATTGALHHLPDFWNMVALKRMHEILRDGGRLYLADLIFSFPIEQHETLFAASVKNATEMVDAEFAKDAATTYSEEFPTFDWVIEGMLDRCGFRIDNKHQPSNTWTNYLCTKS